MDSQTTKALAVALPLGSLAIIGAGVYLALGGSGFGWILAAFGAVDLAATPFVLRAVSARRSGSETASPPHRDPAADRSYNPYARED